MSPSPMLHDTSTSFAVSWSGAALQCVCVAVVVILMSACGTTSDAVVEPWSRGGSQRSEVLPYRKLRAKTAGWRIWEIADKNRVACMAVKPADGTSWPTISPSDGTVTGEGGFYMFILSSLDNPQFAFYGNLEYAVKTTAEVNGTTFVDINNRNTVLAWEGLPVSFQVMTQPALDIYGSPPQMAGAIHFGEIGSALGKETFTPAAPEQALAQGIVDFTGIGDAYEEMMGCLQRVVGS